MQGYSNVKQCTDRLRIDSACLFGIVFYFHKMWAKLDFLI